jgi:futalosine hydrolase
VLILCATRLEMAAFLDRHPVRREKNAVRNLPIYTGSDQSWILALSGPGVFNAAWSLTACLDRFRPKFILHTGIAGVFADTGLAPGDAAVAVTDTYIHAGVDYGRPRRDDPDDPGFGGPRHDSDALTSPFSQSPPSSQALPVGAISSSLRLDPLPFDLISGQADTRRGGYHLDTGLAASCHRRLTWSLTCRVEKGPFVTVSAITGSFEKAAALSAAFSPVMESMEGAAAAHVAALYQVPMVEIRAASNRVGDRDKTRWDIPAAVRTVAEICDVLIEKGRDHGI